MRRLARGTCAAAALVTGLLLHGTIAPGPRRTREIRTWVAVNTPFEPDGSCHNEADILSVSAGRLALNGRTLSPHAIQAALNAQQQRAHRVVFVEGDATAPFGEIAQAFALVRHLQREPAMMTPGLNRALCLGLREQTDQPKKLPGY
jgi:hypothetical protein